MDDESVWREWMTCIRYGHEFGIAAYNLIFTRGTSYGPVFVRCLSVAGDLSKPLDKRISCTVLCRPKETRVSTKLPSSGNLS